MILQRKRFALKEDIPNKTTRCKPKDTPNTKGRPCGGCDLMSENSFIKSSSTGKIFKTPAGNCQTKRLIYGVECQICHKQYTGKTDNQLRSRIAGHRAQVNKIKPPQNPEDPKEEELKDDSALSDHLKEDHDLQTVELFNKSYKFTILEQDPRDIDKAEQHWISKLVTLAPFGLNRERPLSVSDTMLMMNRAAKQYIPNCSIG